MAMDEEASVVESESITQPTEIFEQKSAVLRLRLHEIKLQGVRVYRCTTVHASCSDMCFLNYCLSHSNQVANDLVDNIEQCYFIETSPMRLYSLACYRLH